MACSECTPVCEEIYDNCGCLNPTTFECITQPGTHSSIDVTNDMNGLEVLAAINAKINELSPSEDDSEDKYVKVSVLDTTPNYLLSKIAYESPLKVVVQNPSAAEKLKFSLEIEKLISIDNENLLELGTDNKLRVLFPSTANTVVTEGSGVEVTGDGTQANPYVISINPSISAIRPCFDGVWKTLTLIAPTISEVVYNGGSIKYRIRHDGTIELKGSLTYTVAFGPYTAGTRRFVATVASITSTCLTTGEQAGTSDLKGISYIDVPQAGADQITQQYGYVIRKVNQNIVIEFQSSFSNSTSKTIVINFDGTMSHPNI